jgi:hypothetical protein
MRQFRRAHLEGNYTHTDAEGSLCAQCNAKFDSSYEWRNYPGQEAEVELLRAFKRFGPKIKWEEFDDNPIEEKPMELKPVETLSVPVEKS